MLLILGSHSKYLAPWLIFIVANSCGGVYPLVDPRPVTVPGDASSPLSVASSPLSVASSPPSVAPTPTSVRRASNGSKSTEEALDDSDSDSENDASNRDPDSDTNDETGDPGAGHDDSGNDSSDDSGDDGTDDYRDSNNITRVVCHRLALGEEITPSPPRNLSRRRSTRANSIDGVFVLTDNDPRVLAELPEVVVNFGGSIRPIDGDDEKYCPNGLAEKTPTRTSSGRLGFFPKANSFAPRISLSPYLTRSSPSFCPLLVSGS